VLQHVEAEIAVSRNDLRNLQTWYWPVRGKFRQIYHSRIGENFPPRSNQTRRKVILCVGTVGPRKGQTFLVEAFVQLAAKVPDWQLVLIGREGDATMADRIHELIASNRLEGQIQLLGARNDQEVCKWMEQSEIFAMPSVQEGLGLSLQEALFRGCACVGSRVGGIPELIEDGVNGLLVPAGNVRELANALERLIEDNHLRRAVSDRGSLSILQKKMTAEEMISRYRALYQEILQR